MHTPSHVEFELDLVVAAKETVADGVVVLTLEHPSSAELPGWEPGAHIDLDLGPDLVRQYSMCGDPADRHRWQVGVLLEPDSRGGSRFLHEKLAVGQTVHVRGPRNHFALEPAKAYIFVAGGIGITPIVPMVAAAEAAGAQWRLVYGGRTRASMAFVAELVHRYGDKVEIRPQDETGLLPLGDILGAPDVDTLIYCCGPEALLNAVEDRSRGRWHPGTLHVERFAPKEIGEPVLHEAFEVELAVSGLVLMVPPEKSILQVVEEAGVHVLSSCTEGTCGTCETAVLEGVPDHRDSLLTDEERAANDTMMICVSRSCTPRLVVEL